MTFPTLLRSIAFAGLLAPAALFAAPRNLSLELTIIRFKPESKEQLILSRHPLASRDDGELILVLVPKW